MVLNPKETASIAADSGERRRTRKPGFSSMTAPGGSKAAKQLLHLVFGGELKSLDNSEFVNVAALEVIGIYPNYAEAYKAWKSAAQRTVDNAHMRYFIVHMHRLLDPELTGPPGS